MFNLALISHFYAVVIRIITFKCAYDVITFGSAAIAVRHRLTANQRLTASDVTALWMVTAKSSFMSTTRSYPAMAETVFTAVKLELPALINLF